MKFRVVVKFLTVPFYFSDDNHNTSKDTLNCLLDLEHLALYCLSAGAALVVHPPVSCLSKIPV